VSGIRRAAVSPAWTRQTSWLVRLRQADAQGRWLTCTLGRAEESDEGERIVGRDARIEVEGDSKLRDSDA